MALLYQFGIEPSFAKELIEYEEIDYLVDRLLKIKERLEIIDELRNIDAHRIALLSLQSKKGYRSYLNHKRKLEERFSNNLNDVKEIVTEQKTLFDVFKEENVVSRQKRIDDEIFQKVRKLAGRK